MKNGEKFEYTYKSIGEKERREITDIRNRYTAHSDKQDKRARLKHLDFLVRKLSIWISIAVCIVGVLVFGTGLTFALELERMTTGIIVGSLGLIIMIIAYPIYKAVYILQRKRYAEQIISLSDELLNS